MDDLISRQAAIKLAIDLDYESRGILKESKCREIENRYNMIPSAQSERKTGRWISQDFNQHDGMTSTAVYYYPKCSVCGHTANYTNFCPNCGADMMGDVNNDEG